MSDSITDAAARLSTLLLTKEKELTEREANFNRKVQLFERENPSIGNDTDVIQLNVGGVTNIAILRRTLTQFEDSMLAATFSGRWDDSFKRDRDGNVFVDQDARKFNILIDFLRLRMNHSSSLDIPIRRRPEVTYEFCWMLEYYNLMPGVYPQTWVGNIDHFSCSEKSYNTMVLSTKNSEFETIPAAVNVVHQRFGKMSGSGVSEFTVEFEEGSTGAVGWVECQEGTTISSFSLDKIRENSLFVSLTERKIFGSTATDLSIEHMVPLPIITCRHDGRGEYSINAKDAIPSNMVTATLERWRHLDVVIDGVHRSRCGHLVYPMISFSGKVTVSDLKYEIDRL